MKFCPLCCVCVRGLCKMILPIWWFAHIKMWMASVCLFYNKESDSPRLFSAVTIHTRLKPLFDNAFHLFFAPWWVLSFGNQLTVDDEKERDSLRLDEPMTLRAARENMVALKSYELKSKNRTPSLVNDRRVACTDCPRRVSVLGIYATLNTLLNTQSPPRLVRLFHIWSSSSENE